MKRNAAPTSKLLLAVGRHNVLSFPIALLLVLGASEPCGATKVGHKEHVNSSPGTSGDAEPPAPQAGHLRGKSGQGHVEGAHDKIKEDLADESSSDSALSYLQGRLSGLHEQASILREHLKEAVSWGHELEQELEYQKKAAAGERADLRHFIAQQENETNDALSVERSRETDLETQLSMASSTVKERESTVASLHRKLEKSNRQLRTEEQSWRQHEAELQQEKASALAKVRDREDTIHRLQAAKNVEDNQLALANDRLHQIASIQQQVKAEQSSEDKLKVELREEKKAAATRERNLHNRLAAEQRRERDAQASEQKMRQQFAKEQAHSRKALENTTEQLVEARSDEEGLRQASVAMASQLQGNLSQVAELQQQLASLSRKFEEEKHAKADAEELAMKTQQALESAQAVARQLSGAVPQLLEQAKLAHEARDAEKAMRAETQAQARQQIKRLEDQYAATVQGQLAEIAVPVPGAAPEKSGDSAASSASAASSTAGGEGTSHDAGSMELPVASEDTSPPSADADPDAADASSSKSSAEGTVVSGIDELAAVASNESEDADVSGEASDEARSPDLAGDSQGLGQFLHGASGGPSAPSA